MPSFHWHVQNVTIPCCSQELLPFLSVMYSSLPPFSTNYLSILSHLNLPSISWSTCQSCCSQIHIKYPFGNSIFCQFPFLLSYTGPKILPNTFLTKMFNFFLSLFVSVHISDAYINVLSIIVFDYHHTLQNIPQECRSLFLFG